MVATLRIFLEPDTDGTAELFAEVVCGAFAGAGSAWFGMSELREFGLSLQSTYPLRADSPRELGGGFWSKTESSIEELHVGLKVYPVSPRGNLGVLVRLATPLESSQRPEQQSKVQVELTTNYESLRQFGQAIVSLADGTARAAALEAHGG